MPAPEPKYLGRPVDHWLQLVTSGNDEERWQAIDGIRHVCDPEESIPIFLNTLRSDPSWKARALAAHALYDLALDSQHQAHVSELSPQLVSLLSDPSTEVREQIAELFHVLESTDADA